MPLDGAVFIWIFAFLGEFIFRGRNDCGVQVVRTIILNTWQHSTCLAIIGNQILLYYASNEEIACTLYIIRNYIECYHQNYIGCYMNIVRGN